MTTQNTNALNPSVILPFTATCMFKVPSTELKPHHLPSIFVSLGKFETEAEAENACYAYTDHPALITMQTHQDLRVYPEPLYYKVVCYFSTTPSKDKAQALENGIGRYMGLFTTYSEALNACKPFEGQADYVGRFIGEIWTQEEANHA